MMNYDTFPVAGAFLLEEDGLYHLYYRECHERVWGEWVEVATFPGTTNPTSPYWSAQRIGANRFAGTRWRSVDGVTWAPWPMYQMEYGAPMAAITGGRAHHLVTHNSGTLYVSSNMGVSAQARTVCPNYPEYTWRVEQITMAGEVHALGTPVGDPTAGRYYSYSADLGLAWSEPVQCLPPTPLPWVGGTVHQTSARSYSSVTLHAHANKRIAIAIEDWTEQEYISIYDCPYRPYFPGPFISQHAYQRYTPMDLLYAMSDDGGATWSPVQRIKMDQNQSIHAVGSYAWGGASPRGGPGGMVSDPPGGFALNCCTYDGDLYVFYYCYEIYKRAGQIEDLDDCPTLVGY
jgi:hypothetical protein